VIGASAMGLNEGLYSPSARGLCILSGEPHRGMALVQAQIFPENFSGNFLLFRREHVRLTNRVTDICQELRDSYSLLYDCATCFQHRRYKSSKLGRSYSDWIDTVDVFKQLKKQRNRIMLAFSDGEEFDTTGDLRLTHRKDGVYIIGQNMLIPVESVSEGYELIKLLRGKDAKRNRR